MLDNVACVLANLFPGTRRSSMVYGSVDNVAEPFGYTLHMVPFVPS